MNWKPKHLTGHRQSVPVSQLNVLTKNQTFILSLLSNCTVLQDNLVVDEGNLLIIELLKFINEEGIHNILDHLFPSGVKLTTVLLLDCFINLKSFQLLAILAPFLLLTSLFFS